MDQYHVTLAFHGRPELRFRLRARDEGQAGRMLAAADYQRHVMRLFGLAQSGGFHEWQDRFPAVSGWTVRGLAG